MTKVEFNPAKRDETLAERGLDFADAALVFEGRTKTVADTRFDYGEDRWVTYGWLNAQAVAVVWTVRDDAHRIISMRRMHRWEIVHVGLD